MEPGATVAGKYTIVRKVGSSPIAEVYLARHAIAGGKVEQIVLRRILPELARNDQFSQLFGKVTGVMSALQHPNVLRIIDLGDDGGRFTVSEFVQGQPLRRVQEAARRKGGLHLAHALGIALDLARGLHFAHEMKDGNGYSIGIVHGDVAPANVVLGFDGVARIQDFGMVWVEAAVPASDPSLLTEKFPYMSPERVFGAPLDRRSDLFSLGLVLYELITGVPAFSAATPKELMAKIVECKLAPPSSVKEGFAPDLERVLMKALSRVPDERHPTVAAFAAAVQGVMEKRNLSTSPTLLGGYLRGLFGAGAVVEPAAGAAPARRAQAPVVARESNIDVVRGAVESRAGTRDDPDAIPPGRPLPVPSGRPTMRPTPSRPPWAADLDAQKEEITQAKLIAAERQALAKREADAAAARKAEAQREIARQSAHVAERGREADRESRTRRDVEGELRAQLAREVEARKAAEERADAAAEVAALSKREAEEAQERERSASERAEQLAKAEADARKKLADASAREAVAGFSGKDELAAAKKAAEDAERREADAKAALAKESAARKAAEESAVRDAAARKSLEERAATAKKELEAAREEAKSARKRADEAAQRLTALSKEIADKRETDATGREAALRAELDAATAREAQARAETEAASERESTLRGELEELRRGLERAETSARTELAEAHERAESLAIELETAKRDAQRLADGVRAELEGRVEAATRSESVAKRELEENRIELDAARRDAEAARLEAEAARQERSAATRDAEASKRAAATVRKKWETAEKEKEELRAELEALRTEGEEGRGEADAALAEADVLRRQIEAARKLADAAASEAEAAKGVAEAATQEAEAARREADVLRQEAEASHEELESLRAEVAALGEELEGQRSAGDAARLEAESIRQEAETIREQAEAARLEAESARLEALANAQAAGADAAAAGTADDGHAAPRLGMPQVSLYLSAFADAPRTNLTADTGSFVGREEVMRALDLLLKEDARVHSVVGADGSGRTRLVRRFASTKLVELSQEGGAWYVDLSAARDAEAVACTVAAALSIAVAPSAAASDSIRHVGAALGTRGRMLLVLDGIDGVADVLRGVLGEWIAVAPDARFLLAGRAPLGIQGEGTRAIGGLDLPTPSSPVESEAMALFVTRARERRRQQGAGAEGGLPIIAKIVKLLDGNPLAIELVAARADVGAPSKLHAELAKALGGDTRNPLAKVLEWVWTQLAPAERDALSQLSLFHGGFTSEAAEDVIDLSAHSPAASEYEVLRTLRARGLVGGEDLLLELHPAVRAFAMAKLDESGDAPAAAERHAARTLRAGRSASAELERAGSREGMRRLALETGNLLAVLERAVDESPATVASATQALAAVQCLAAAAEVVGPFDTCLGWMDAALAAAGKLPVDKRLRAETLLARGRLRRVRGDVKGSTGDLYDAHDIAAVGDDRGFESAVLAEVGLTLQAKGKLEEAKKALEQALNLARMVSDDRREGQALAHLGALHEAAGRTAEARRSLEDAAATFARGGARRSEGAALAALGAFLLAHGDAADARGILERAIAIHREVRDRAQEGASIGRLAAATLETGEPASARELFGIALGLQQERGDRRAEGVLRGQLGILEQLDGNAEEARALLVKAIYVLGDIGESKLEGIFLGFLAALVSAAGTLDTGAESFGVAREQLEAAKDAAALEALDLLGTIYEVAKAQQAGDRAAVESIRAAALRDVGEPLGNSGGSEWVRLAKRVVRHCLAGDAQARSPSRAPATGRG